MSARPHALRWRAGLAPLAAGGLLAAACTQDVAPPPVRNLDRPSSVAFGCYGDYRINGGDPAAPGTLAVSAQPLESCRQHATGEPPEGQESREGEPALLAPRLFGFVVQSARGTVAVVDNEAQTVLDSDPLSPGKNAIPVGTLPVGIAPDASGCFMVTANAGSCDLTGLDVNAALDIRSEARIARIAITGAGGERLRAKPRAIAAGPGEETIGLECPAQATGLVYVAFPACHTVAAVDAATGAVVAGVQFAEDGTATVTDGEITCPSECGDGAIVPTGGGGLDGGVGPDGGLGDGGPGGPPTTDDTAPRPVAVELADDGRLYIAAENSPIITQVEVDAAGLPVAINQAQLEGSVGVTAFSVSHVIEMGGELGTLGGSAGQFRFLYAVASDRTVRVLDVGRMTECDTQVDPRYLYDVRDVALLSCLPVGGADTPPRRAGARSPGIHIPRGAAPLDVAISLVNPGTGVGEVSPIAMVGTFAFVTTSDGFVYVVNVDDDNYPDFEDTNDPTRAALPLAMAHQLRDFVRNRSALPANCGYPSAEPLDLSPRVSEPPLIGFTEGRIAPGKLGLLPTLRQVMCTAGETPEPVSELSFGAPVPLRESAFPDLRESNNETFTITWEGALSRDGVSSEVDGPPVRVGRITAEGGQVALEDPAAPFCAIGAEEQDVLVLAGCDPSVGSAQCGLGETCYVHPDSPTVVASGVCLPSDQIDALSGGCRNFLITRRQYSIRETSAGRLLLGVRRRVLRTTPLAGCESDAQCETLADVEATLPDPAHPIDLEDAAAAEGSWVCAPDPTRASSGDKCQMSCETSEDCDAGHACQGGFCVEGVLPPAQCVAALQRYQVRASEAFVVIGDRTGYLHDRVRDPDTGLCVEDPDASPLLAGRIPLDPPDCTGDGIADLSPNPCRTTVEQSETIIPYQEQGGRCVSGPQQVRTRAAEAIRLRNPALTMHLIDPSTTGDEVCIGDMAGDLPPFSGVYPGFQLVFSIVGGFFPMFATAIEAAFPNQIAASPDGRLWVLDEGDASSTTQGRIFTLDPTAAPDGFGVVTIL